MCAKVRIKRLLSGLHIRNRICAQIRNFLPSGPEIFQTGSSSLPFPVVSMPASAYSCVPRCVYTVNTRLPSGLHVPNRIFAQIRHFFAIRTRNFPNRIQFLSFSGRSYANFCLLFFVLYSALLHLPPLRFRCANGCWDRTQDRCNWCIGSQTL
jgi:hypothetical protein